MAHALGNELRSEQFIVRPIMNVVKPNIRCYDNEEALVEAAARLIAERITWQIEVRGKCRLALAVRKHPASSLSTTGPIRPGDHG